MGAPVQGDFPAVGPGSGYTIGHVEPTGFGDKMVVTSAAHDAATGWNVVVAQLSRLGGWDISAGHGSLSTMIDAILAEHRRDGRPFKQIVTRSHAFQATLTLDRDYRLADETVKSQFARLRLAGALASQAQIEFQGCNIAAGIDGPAGAMTAAAIQGIADVTGAFVEASPHMQRANRFGWTGQVVRFSPRR